MNVRLLLDVKLPDAALGQLQQLVHDQPAAIIVFDEPAMVQLGARLVGAQQVHTSA